MKIFPWNYLEYRMNQELRKTSKQQKTKNNTENKSKRHSPPTEDDTQPPPSEKRQRQCRSKRHLVIPLQTSPRPCKRTVSTVQ